MAAGRMGESTATLTNCGSVSSLKTSLSPPRETRPGFTRARDHGSSPSPSPPRRRRQSSSPVQASRGTGATSTITRKFSSKVLSRSPGANARSRCRSRTRDDVPGLESPVAAVSGDQDSAGQRRRHAGISPVDYGGQLSTAPRSPSEGAGRETANSTGNSRTAGSQRNRQLVRNSSAVSLQKPVLTVRSARAVSPVQASPQMPQRRAPATRAQVLPSCASPVRRDSAASISHSGSVVVMKTGVRPKLKSSTLAQTVGRSVTATPLGSVRNPPAVSVGSPDAGQLECMDSSPVQSRRDSPVWRESAAESGAPDGSCDVKPIIVPRLALPEAMPRCASEEGPEVEHLAHSAHEHAGGRRLSDTSTTTADSSSMWDEDTDAREGSGRIMMAARTLRHEAHELGKAIKVWAKLSGECDVNEANGAFVPPDMYNTMFAKATHLLHKETKRLERRLKSPTVSPRTAVSDGFQRIVAELERIRTATANIHSSSTSPQQFLRRGASEGSFPSPAMHLSSVSPEIAEHPETLGSTPADLAGDGLENHRVVSPDSTCTTCTTTPPSAEDVPGSPTSLAFQPRALVAVPLEFAEREECRARVRGCVEVATDAQSRKGTVMPLCLPQRSATAPRARNVDAARPLTPVEATSPGGDSVRGAAVASDGNRLDVRHGSVKCRARLTSGVCSHSRLSSPGTPTRVRIAAMSSMGSMNTSQSMGSLHRPYSRQVSAGSLFAGPPPANSALSHSTDWIATEGSDVARRGTTILGTRSRSPGIRASGAPQNTSMSSACQPLNSDRVCVNRLQPSSPSR